MNRQSKAKEFTNAQQRYFTSIVILLTMSPIIVASLANGQPSFRATAKGKLIQSNIIGIWSCNQLNHRSYNFHNGGRIYDEQQDSL